MQKILFTLILSSLVLFGCNSPQEYSSVDPVNWKKRSHKIDTARAEKSGSTYLSIYSQIYSQTESRTHDLTATVSIRNTNPADTIYLESAKYFDTHGNLIRNYFEEGIFVAPMETVEIIIDEKDRSGGTGANFMFDWVLYNSTLNCPFFEAVMISTSGQQGLSFTTTGINLN